MTEQEKGGYSTPRYLWTSEELLDPSVGAVEIGALESGKFQEVNNNMRRKAKESGIGKPLMIADLIFKEGKESELGSKGQPYPIVEEEWETFVRDIPEYCGNLIPRVYIVDGSKFTAPI